MAKPSSSRKAWRVSVRRHARNRSTRSATRTLVRNAEAAIFDGESDEAAQAVRMAIRALDKAAEKGIIHPNNAARRKSRLMKKYNAAIGSESSPA